MDHGRVDVPLRLIVREINRWIRGERVEVGLARDRVAAGGPRSLSRLEKDTAVLGQERGHVTNRIDGYVVDNGERAAGCRFLHNELVGEGKEIDHAGPGY